MDNRQVISSSRIRVVVGNNVFEISQEKAQQLISMLQSWQSIAIPEHQNINPYGGYNGQTLVCG
tara:strand:+ start:283 stop:474 length:192 start_codon:yes stop_codon:yes gene_type:complete